METLSPATERGQYVDMIREASRHAQAELDVLFDAGHVATPIGTPEYDAIRLAPSAVRSALYGPAGSERLRPDVWLQQIEDRLPAGATIDDAVDQVARLVAARVRYGRAAKVGAPAEVILGVLVDFVTSDAELDHVHALFSGVQSVDMVPCPGAADGDFATRADALRVELEAQAKRLEDLRVERDRMVVALRMDGWGYDRIARTVGISKQRACQLCAGLPSIPRETGWHARPRVEHEDF